MNEHVKIFTVNIVDSHVKQIDFNAPGSLPFSLNISASLMDVSLSHNLLSGEVPLEMQVRCVLMSFDVF